MKMHFIFHVNLLLFSKHDSVKQQVSQSSFMTVESEENLYFIEADYERWSSWNFFIKIRVFFFIVVYDFHVLCLYSSHLIRSSNCASWIHHLMSSIKSTKYESSSLLTVTNSSSDTCCLIRSCFENSNKLTWNIECIFISSDKSSSYA